MDILDKKILDIMSNQARITMKDLAKELGISAPAAAERVKRLEQQGIIESYKAIINRDKLGQHISVFINLDITAKDYDNFKVYAANKPEISEFYYVTGPHSVVCKAFVRDTYHLAELLAAMQSFGPTETYVVMYTNIKDNSFGETL